MPKRSAGRILFTLALTYAAPAFSLGDSDPIQRFTIVGNQAGEIFRFLSLSQAPRVVIDGESRADIIDLPKIGCIRSTTLSGQEFRCILQMDTHGNLIPSDSNLIGISN